MTQSDQTELSPGAEPEDADIRDHTTSKKANLELLFVALAGLVVSLSQSILVPVLPELNGKYGANATWMLTATLLVAAVAVPVFGRLGDMFGKRRMLLICLVLLTIGSLVDAVGDSLGVLIAGRAIQGLGMAIIPLGISLLATLMPREKVGSAVALISAMLGVGGALGLPLAGLVAQNWDWHILMWISAAVSLISLIGIWVVVPESHQHTGGRIDVPGTILITGGLVCLILPLEQSAEWGWGSAKVWLLLAAAVVLFAILVAVELRTKEPLVDLRALARKPIALTNLASICFGFALFASFIGTATFVSMDPDIFPAGETAYGFGSGAFVAGLTMLPSGLMMLLFAPVAARLIVLRGAPQTLALGALIVAVGWAERIVLTDHLWEVIVGSTIIGLGTGIGYAAMPTLINTNTPPHEIAAANGLNSLFRSLGSTLATAVGSSLLASMAFDLSGAEVPTLAGYRWLFAICAAAAVLAAALVLTVPRSPRG
ncbi:MFS transporter [Nocardioides sp. Kera G14]|uniref:MFS transporter n=1 Tax=Nocardioides sp. Kera G14 TaxID=2884264 RepID=UPI001D121A5B|nr:MFS transporter [Nocardioides sp. Kera G14]UDY23383.1 MFS transporter [Nocardioides sp. Kera G14]